MSEPQPKGPNSDVVSYRLANIEKNLDRLVDRTVTREQFEEVQSRIDDLKDTIEKKTAAKWVENVVWIVLAAIVTGFIGALWFLIQHAK